MIDARTQALLQDLVRRASRSMLHYVGEAYPWTPDTSTDLLTKVRTVIDEEEAAVEGLATFLRKKRIPIGYLGSYPQHFTYLNYVSLDYLMPRLLDWQSKWTAVLDRDAALIADPEAKGEVAKLVTVARRHLDELQNLTASHFAAGAH
jgi:hypothetical protein